MSSEHKKINPSEKERKILAIVMAIGGAIIWLLTPIKWQYSETILRFVGIVLFIFGLTKINPRRKPLDQKQKIIMIIVGLIVLILVVLTFLFLR